MRATNWVFKSGSYSFVLKGLIYDAPFRTHTLTHTHTNTLTLTHTLTHTRSHTHTHTHTYTLTHTLERTHARTHSHVRAHIHTTSLFLAGLSIINKLKINLPTTIQVLGS